jgi:hypothetical protein
MNCAASQRWKWQSLTIFTAVLISAAALIAVSASGCGPNAILILDCRDGGPPDGGDAGNNGNGGNDLPYCNN